MYQQLVILILQISNKFMKIYLSIFLLTQLIIPNHMKNSLLVLLVCFVYVANSFYVYIDKNSPQCFFSNIYKDERLLIQIQTPIISLAHKILVSVKNDNNTLLEKGVINQIKLTVPRPSNSISNQITGQALQYQTCLQLVPDQTTNSTTIQQNDDPVIEREGYLLSVKLMTNFQHKLQNVKQKQATNVDYKQIQDLSKILMKINTQQINLHQINEVKEKLSQMYLQNLKTRVIVYSMLQILMVSIFTVLQIRIFKRYLNNVSIV